jgi:hypothetical protein
MGNKQAKIDPKEAAKEQKRIMRKSQRQLERESKKLESQEAKALKEIKKMATAGHHDAAKILSKDVARNRAMRKQYLVMGSQLKSMELQM